MNRRTFFTNLVRMGLIAGITGISAIALQKGHGDRETRRLPGNFCNDCRKSGSCNLPESQMALNQQNHLCPSKEISEGVGLQNSDSGHSSKASEK